MDRQRNDDHFKLAKIEGEFVWHAHADTDEVFIVLDGARAIGFRDGELADTVNTGDAPGDRTASDGMWV